MLAFWAAFHRRILLLDCWTFLLGANMAMLSSAIDALAAFVFQHHRRNARDVVSLLKIVVLVWL